MKKGFVAISFMIALLLSVDCQAETKDSACGGFDDAWQSCKEDSDCAAGQTMCGFPSAYNKDSLEAVNKYNKCMGPMISCAVPPQEPPSGAVICKDGACRFVENQADSVIPPSSPHTLQIP